MLRPCVPRTAHATPEDRRGSTSPRRAMGDQGNPQEPPNFRTSSFHRGSDWEAGRVGPACNEEAPLGVRSPLGRRSEARVRLTGTVQGMLIFMRWAAPHGWCLAPGQNCKPNHKFDSAALQELQLSHLMDRRVGEPYADAQQVRQRARRSVQVAGAP